MRKGILGKDGVEELPLKLIIIAIVVAITIPIMVDSLSNFSNDQVLSDIRAEIAKVVTAIKLSYSSGIGTSIPVTVSLQNGVMTSIDYIKIGDTRGAVYEAMIRFKVSTDNVQYIQIEPYIPVTYGPAGFTSPMTLSAGHYHLHAVHRGDGGNDYVEMVLD